MKNILKLALVAVALLVFSCGKNNDDTQTENTRLVGTWKCIKREDVKDGKRVNSQDVKDDGCNKYVFTDKILTYYSLRDKDNECVGKGKPYKIKNGTIYVEEDNEYSEWYNKTVLVDNNTLELWDSDGISGAIFICKRVK